jgi:hypothetical protein
LVGNTWEKEGRGELRLRRSGETLNIDYDRAAEEIAAMVRSELERIQDFG